MEIVVMILSIYVLSYLVTPLEFVWWFKPILHGSIIAFVLWMHKKDQQGSEPMRHNQIDEEQNHTQQVYENKQEHRCPVCDTILIVKNGDSIENVQCGECHCVVGDYEHNKNTTELGANGICER